MAPLYCVMQLINSTYRSLTCIR